jgi:Na+(H+)/acetate symporter ActP
MTGAIAITIAMKNTTSATLSSFPPISLCCFVALAINPSAKSLTPQYVYNIQKCNENGAVKGSITAQISRVAVIMLAQFLIETTSQGPAQ